MESIQPSFENAMRSERSIESIQMEKEQIKKLAIENKQLIYDREGKFLYALAPNGARSVLGEKEWIEVRTTSFKEWFGDWEHDHENASKIINHETQEPLVVYHQTNNTFDVFDKEKIRVGGGFYFSEGDYTFGDNILSCFLNIKNPKKDRQVILINPEMLESLKRDGYDGMYCDTLTMHVKGSKYAKIASIMIRNVVNKTKNFFGFETFSRSAMIRGKKIKDPNATFLKFLELVAFEPNQIKSAENKGTFSKNSDNIYE